jgi:hypothetical protein
MTRHARLVARGTHGEAPGCKDASIAHAPLSNSDSLLAPGSHTINPAWRTDFTRRQAGRRAGRPANDPGFSHDFLKRGRPEKQNLQRRGAHGGAVAAGSSSSTGGPVCP